MTYDSGSDALRQLVLLRMYGGHISRSPENIITLPAESYYFVEVTSWEGTKYVIEAYGEEAIELEHEASTRKLEEEILITG